MLPQLDLSLRSPNRDQWPIATSSLNPLNQASFRGTTAYRILLRFGCSDTSLLLCLRAFHIVFGACGRSMAAGPPNYHYTLNRAGLALSSATERNPSTTQQLTRSPGNSRHHSLHTGSVAGLRKAFADDCSGSSATFHTRIPNVSPSLQGVSVSSARTRYSNITDKSNPFVRRGSEFDPHRTAPSSPLVAASKERTAAHRQQRERGRSPHAFGREPQHPHGRYQKWSPPPTPDRTRELPVEGVRRLKDTSRGEYEEDSRAGWGRRDDPSYFAGPGQVTRVSSSRLPESDEATVHREIPKTNPIEGKFSHQERLRRDPVGTVRSQARRRIEQFESRQAASNQYEPESTAGLDEHLCHRHGTRALKRAAQAEPSQSRVPGHDDLQGERHDSPHGKWSAWLSRQNLQQQYGLERAYLRGCAEQQWSFSANLKPQGRDVQLPNSQEITPSKSSAKASPNIWHSATSTTPPEGIKRALPEGYDADQDSASLSLDSTPSIDGDLHSTTGRDRSVQDGPVAPIRSKPETTPTQSIDRDSDPLAMIESLLAEHRAALEEVVADLQARGLTLDGFKEVRRMHGAIYRSSVGEAGAEEELPSLRAVNVETAGTLQYLFELLESMTNEVNGHGERPSLAPLADMMAKDRVALVRVLASNHGD